MPVADGRKVVATAGTRVQLSSGSTAIRSVEITALPTNTGVVAVGGTTVSAVAGAERGILLSAGARVRFDADDQVDDLNQIWIDATASGEGVTYLLTAEA